jgi:hypothetical protein
LQALGAILSIAGIIIEIINRNILGKSHFGHLHSIFGEIFN